MASDYLIRATAAQGMVKAVGALTTKAVARAKEIHKLSPTASAALGRSLMGAALLSTSLKGKKHSLTLQIKGDGPLGSIVVVADADSNVRGYVSNPGVHLPLNEAGKLNVGAGIGKGYLNIIKDLGLKEPYIGQVNLVSGEIGEDIAYYCAYSEQIPTVVSLGVLVDFNGNIVNSGGYFLQLMPGADESLISHIENKVNSIKPVTSLITEGLLPEDIINLLLGEKGVSILGKTDIKYKCTCSRDRMERNLISLGKKELHKLVDEQENIETQCHFCNTRYLFNGEDIGKLI